MMAIKYVFNPFTSNFDAVDSAAASSGTPATDLFTVTDTGDKTYTLSDTPLSETEFVMLNGQTLSKGAGEDYTVSGNDIVLDASCVLFVGDKILVKYRK